MHAGCTGDVNAVITATDFHPSYLRVADTIAPAELLTRRQRKHPQLAYQCQETKELKLGFVARPFLGFGPSCSELRDEDAAQKRCVRRPVTGFSH